MTTTHSYLSRGALAWFAAITSFVAPLSIVEGAALTISGITHEEVGYRPDCASQFGGTITGTGMSSLLGWVSIEAHDCLTKVENSNSLSFAGAMTFNLSSGDEIFAHYSGFFVPTTQPSLFTFKDSFFTIMGGTKNFSKATGGGTLQGVENILSGWAIMQATGTISGFKQDKKKSEPTSSHQRGADSTINSAFMDIGGFGDATEISDLNNSAFQNTQTLGDFFYQDQNGQLVAVNELPESGSLSLLGIGLLALAVTNRRRLRRLPR